MRLPKPSASRRAPWVPPWRGHGADWWRRITIWKVRRSMPHVDEGTLHALLDGELAPEALAEVRVHFATCPSCAARLDEARQLLAETERLVSALELPNRTAPPRAAREAEGGRDPRPATAGVVADLLTPSSPG